MSNYNKNPITFDYNNMLKDYVGNDGFTVEELKAASKDAVKAFKAVKAGRGLNMMGWTDLPYNQKLIFRFN